MQDTFNKRDYMSVGVEEMRNMKTLEIDDAGSVIMVRNGVRMSPLRLDQVKAMTTPEILGEMQENSQERLDLKQQTLAKAIQSNNEPIDMKLMSEEQSKEDRLE